MLIWTLMIGAVKSGLIFITPEFFITLPAVTISVITMLEAASSDCKAALILALFNSLISILALSNNNLLFCDANTTVETNDCKSVQNLVNTKVLYLLPNKYLVYTAPLDLTFLLNAVSIAGDTLNISKSVYMLFLIFASTKPSFNSICLATLLGTKVLLSASKVQSAPESSILTVPRFINHALFAVKLVSVEVG